MRFLRALLPRGVGDAALADLERELELRHAARGHGWSDRWWIAREVILLAVRLRIARAGRRTHTASAGTSTRLGPTSGWVTGTDLRLIARGLTRSPGLSLAAVMVLALGVGAPTAMYSIGRGLTAPLPVDDPEELVFPGWTDNQNSPTVRGLNAAELELLRARPGVLGTVAGYTLASFDLSGEMRDPERLGGARVTPDLLALLREQPVAGRDFVPGDAVPGAPAVALIGEGLWTRRFGRDSTVLGSSIQLDKTDHTVVGILPEHLRFPAGAEIWVPLATPLPSDEMHRHYEAVARVPVRVDRDRVRAELAPLAAAASPDGGASEGPRLTLENYVAGSMIDRKIEVILGAMLGLVSLLLLVSAANVANLLLARAVGRSRELAVRVAMGAGPRRLVTHDLTQAGILSLAGGLLGLVVATGLISTFRRAVAHELLWWMEIRLDPAAGLYAALLMALATVMAGIVPALQAMSAHPADTLKREASAGGAFRFSRLSQGLVVAEVTVSAALLIVAGLMVKGALLTARSGDFDPTGILAASYELPSGTINGTTNDLPDGGAVSSFHRELIERIGKPSGATGAVFAADLPGLGNPIHLVEIEGQPVASGAGSTNAESPRARTQIAHVSPGLFDLIGRPVLRGRDIEWSDGAGDPPAVIVNEAFVRRYLAGGEALGRRVRLHPPVVQSPVLATIVGVTPALRTQVGREEVDEAIYVPVTVGTSRGWVLIGSAGSRDAMTLVPELRAALRSLDPDQPLLSIDLLERHLGRARSAESVFARLFAAFGLAGLLIACTGLYGVMSFTIGRRTREAGVRVALGAGPARVAWPMARAGIAQLGLGLALGIGIAAVLGPTLGDALMGVSPRDPAVYSLVTAVLLIAGLSAAAIPTLRAMRVQPTEALKSE